MKPRTKAKDKLFSINLTILKKGGGGHDEYSNKEHSYDKAMTIALEEELDMLGVQPRSVAIAAAEKVRGKWYKGKVFKVIDAKRIYPARHYPAIMAHINKQATEWGHTFIE